MIVAQKPHDHIQFLSAFADAPSTQTASGPLITTRSGEVEVMTPADFLRRFGVVAPDTARGARLAALRFAVAQPSRLQALPELAGLGGLYVGNAVVIGAEDAMAVLVFEPQAR